MLLLRDVFLVTCLDFIMQTENELPLDILIVLDEVCDQDDRFIDDADTSFWNCLAYTLSMDNFDLKKKSLQEFCSACKVTLFEEHLIHKLIKIDESVRRKKLRKSKHAFAYLI